MKRTVVALLAVIGMSTISFGQIVTIEINGSGDISGTQYDVVSGGGEVHRTARVTNLTSDTMQLRVTRDRIATFPSWEDRICWGVEGDPFGACYSFKVDNPWTTPVTDTVILDTNQTGLLDIYIDPIDPDYGCAVYRYRIMHWGVAVDSVDIGVCKTAQVDEPMNTINISAFPNPANQSLTIDLSGSSYTTVNIFNLLGHQVMAETEMADKTIIDVSTFKNGFYFIRATSPSSGQIIKKVVIKHD